MNSCSPRISALTAAAAVSIEVKQGIRFTAAARRMWKPSRSVSVMRPSGVNWVKPGWVEVPTEQELTTLHPQEH